jgi:hypothetical protein
MPEVVSVICLSQDVKGFALQAVEILNGSQSQFAFQQVPDVLHLPPPDLSGVYSWDLLGRLLVEKKREVQAKYLLAVLDQPIENNWFSSTWHEQKIAFITTYDWGYLCTLPVVSFVAFELVENFVEMMLGVIDYYYYHDDTRGCISDMCALKPDISFKIRTADICCECRDLFLRYISPTDLEAVTSMLEVIRRVSLRREDKRVIVSTALSDVDRIDREYPFPIAYCFRSMQAELSYSRKWLKLLELYEVTIKYVTFILISALLENQRTVSPEIVRHLVGLKRPSGGHWHQACFALVKYLRNDPDTTFIARYLAAFDSRKIRQSEAASSKLVPLRNDTRGHGFIEEEAQYQARYHQNISEIQTLVEFVSPLSGYRLIKVGEQTRHHGVFQFPAKVLMGSHPLFPVEEHRTTAMVDSDCLLYDPETGNYLSLYPWLLLHHCTECFRETIFLYDKLEDNSMVVREYPTNHTQKVQIDLPQGLTDLI